MPHMDECSGILSVYEKNEHWFYSVFRDFKTYISSSVKGHCGKGKNTADVFENRSKSMKMPSY
jgi:hypothetical protein